MCVLLPTVLNPCSELTCLPGEECTVDMYGIARCECPPPCEPVMRPVCGSDDVTYDNFCELHRAVCVKQTDIVVSYVGVCGEIWWIFFVVIAIIIIIIVIIRLERIYVFNLPARYWLGKNFILVVDERWKAFGIKANLAFFNLQSFFLSSSSWMKD